MGFDDIFKGEADERARREHERRQMLLALPDRADEARDNAQAAVVKALSTIQDLGPPGFASTGYPPPPQGEAVKRAFAVTVRTKDGKYEFLVTGVLECRIEDGRFAYEHEPLRLHASGFQFMQPRTRAGEFTNIRAGSDEPTYEVEALSLQTALEDLVRQMAA
ncbi:MAG TPA: hypothetical protein VFB22_14185 [Candidatus Baltobacteraceae bacterium]|nr:hypothetical protein [Candidatus Baltobacteraceae bacterium]